MSNQNRNFGDFRTLSDFSRKDSESYHKTVFFGVISVCEFITPRAFWYDLRSNDPKKSIFGYGTCQISRFWGFRTLSDFSWPNDKRYNQIVFSSVISVYLSTTARAFRYDTRSHVLKSRIYWYGPCQISRFWSTLPPRFCNFSIYISLLPVMMVLNERTDFKVYLPRMI